jgi:hypothetical protein
MVAPTDAADRRVEDALARDDAEGRTGLVTHLTKM